MKDRKFARPIIAGLSLALISGAAFAYGGSHGNKMGKGGCDDKSARMEHSQKQRGGMMQLPSAVIEQLNLNETQKVALFDAQVASKAMRDSMRESMREARQQRQEASESAKFDPREMFKEQDERMAKMQQARQSIQQQWLGFWDTLSDEQKSVVQDYMQSKTKGEESKRS
ncbi:MAG: Spy/CpxP family protein refolding chaperone [Burkholderiaceae bacterium]|nr:Spy/CpxP family protein refolding chaperone [Burkholderiaceae bacterium]MCD8516905.1 Spy/CpxP family protein refolding chaperone [Burkholderiaceae bacterium]MCD8537577.1 Spy/CpxP family protein refolding chaperone [Burkholderiaceae bacterium]MCD8565613.1 Spy/CpxP family protein refolding chaperone [Burkholderiaceae bacterium]